MKIAKVHLTNGEVAVIHIVDLELDEWIDSIISAKGISTEESFFPYHSIAYIIFEDPDNPERTERIQIAQEQENNSERYSEAEMD